MNVEDALAAIERVEKPKEKKKKRMCTWAFLSIKQSFFSAFSFLSTLERKLFGGPEEKTSESHHLFSFLPTQPITLQKSFPSHFLSKVFHPSYFTSKQTEKRHGQQELGTPYAQS